MGFRQRTLDSSLLLVSFLPLTAYRLPLTAYRLPLTAYRLPLTAYRLPLTAYRLISDELIRSFVTLINKNGALGC
ncbi:hypothetical protein L1D46_16705 [Pseudoalteromonas sp. Isolate3]|uniref:hypothetical protein n=1 Tax=Pseudoalteromonas sp. Isolate3 TaxID=2908526 RepID=UPI001EFD96A4|nr:hypothetical protein [Pseudoalteromonas sp. Isolate3]MCG9710438.1 hypothetical protein [Pseudoalteromonas sp. Isolate3]